MSHICKEPSRFGLSQLSGRDADFGVLWLAPGEKYPSKPSCCPSHSQGHKPCWLCLTSSSSKLLLPYLLSNRCGKTQTRGTSPALRGPAPRGPAPAPRATRSHDPPLHRCLSPPPLPGLPPCPSALMGPDSAALFLTPRRVLRAGAPGPGEVALLQRAAVPHHIAERCPRRWTRLPQRPSRPGMAPGSRDTAGLAPGSRDTAGVALAAGTCGVQLRERAAVPAARQGSLSLR